MRKLFKERIAEQFLKLLKNSKPLIIWESSRLLLCINSNLSPNHRVNYQQLKSIISSQRDYYAFKNYSIPEVTRYIFVKK